MVYLVSKNKSLFVPELYTEISFNKALDILKPLSLVQFDTETSGLDCWTKEILTIQLGNKENQVVLDWTTLTEEEKKVLKEYLESDITLLGWNLSFDLTFCYKNNIWPKHIWDGMIADQLIFLGYPRSLTIEQYDNQPGYELVDSHYELSYSLKSAAKRWCNIDIDKSVRGKINQVGLTPEVIVYAANDVRWLEDIKNEQEKEIANQELGKAVEFECEFVKSLAYVKYCGIHLDVEKWKAKMASDLAKKEQALKELNDYVVNLDKQEWFYRTCADKHEVEKVKTLHFEYVKESDKGEVWKYHIKGKFIKVNLQGDLWSGFDTEPQCTINWDSSQQVIPLFEIIGIQTHTFDKKTKKEKKSIEEKQIAPQKDKFPIVKIFLRYQGAAKVVSTYGENWLNAINPVTGRIHAELHSIGTDTARISSGGGVYKLNLQNLPSDPETRSCFTAEKGNKFISCDYQSQESRLIASVSKDKAMIDLFENGCGDVHSLVAYMSYPSIIPRDTRIEDIKEKYHQQRQDAKGIEFAVNYGGDFNTIANNKGIPIKEAEKIYNDFMNGFRGIKKYQDYCRAVVMQKGYILMNPVFGHRAHIYDNKFLLKMQEKFKEPGFWEYYREMKQSSPYCDTVLNVKQYFKRKSESEKQSINYRINLYAA